MNSFFKKSFSLLLTLCLMLLAFGLTVRVNATVDDSVFTHHTTALVEGDYLIVYNDENVYRAMKNTVSPKSRLDYAEISINVDGTFSNIDSSLIWHIKKLDDGTWTIYNSDVDKYVASTGTKSQAVLVSESTSSNIKWKVTLENETFDFENVYNKSKNVNAYLRNNNTVGFACYASTGIGGLLSLYKKPDTTKISSPSGFSVQNNLVTIDEVVNASGYQVGVFDSESSEKPLYTFSSDTNKVTIIDVPQNTEYIIKVLTIGSGSFSNSDYFGTTPATTFTNTQVSEYSVEHINKNITNQTSEPFIFYQVTGYVQQVSNTGITIADTLESSVFLWVNGIENIGDYGFNVGDKVKVKAYKKSNHLYGATVLDHIINYGDRFASLETLSRLQVKYNFNDVQKEVTQYEKVTEEPVDWSGDYLLVYENGNKAYVFNGNDDFSDFILADIDNGKISFSSELEAVKVKIASMNGGYSLNVFNASSNSNKYMSGTSGSNKLNFGDSEVLNTISFDSASNKVTIISNTSVFVFNKTANQMRFRYYKPATAAESSYVKPYLYKKVTSYDTVKEYSIAKNEEGKSQVSLMFGGFINKDLYDKLVEIEGTQFGILYAKQNVLNGNTLKSLISDVNNGTKTFDAVLESGVRKMDLTDTMALVDKDGNLNENGTQYQLGVTLSEIAETNFNTEVTAACYVLYEGVYYLMAEKNHSVNSIAGTYLDAADTSSYEVHLEMLAWLKNYNG